MSEIHEFHSIDPASKANKEAYNQMVASIRQRLDPKSNTVLIVDDERAIRRLVARNIQKSDATVVVHEAANGQEALEQLEKIRCTYERDPLFIVLDLNMPIMDGWETIRLLKEEYETAGDVQGIPIIVLSSTSGEKGLTFFRKSIHGGKSGYVPLVSIAKEACKDPSRYDAVGDNGLDAWMGHFIRQNLSH